MRQLTQWTSSDNNFRTTQDFLMRFSVLPWRSSWGFFNLIKTPVGLPGDWLQVENQGYPLRSRSVFTIFYAILLPYTIRTKFRLPHLCSPEPGVQWTHKQHRLMSTVVVVASKNLPSGSNLEPLGTWCVFAMEVFFNRQKMLFVGCPTDS